MYKILESVEAPSSFPQLEQVSLDQQTTRDPGYRGEENIDSLVGYIVGVNDLSVVSRLNGLPERDWDWWNSLSHFDK